MKSLPDAAPWYMISLMRKFLISSASALRSALFDKPGVGRRKLLNVGAPSVLRPSLMSSLWVE